MKSGSLLTQSSTAAVELCVVYDAMLRRSDEALRYHATRCHMSESKRCVKLTPNHPSTLTPSLKPNLRLHAQTLPGQRPSKTRRRR